MMRQYFSLENKNGLFQTSLIRFVFPFVSGKVLQKQLRVENNCSKIFWRLTKGMYFKASIFYLSKSNDVPSFGAEPCEWQILLILAYYIWKVLLLIIWIISKFIFQIKAGYCGFWILWHLGWLSHGEFHLVCNTCYEL